MPPYQHSDTLHLELEVPQFAVEPELEIYLHRYATELCSDLDLPLTPSLSLKSFQQKSFDQPGLFLVTINGEACRSRWWPETNLPNRPSGRDVFELIALVIYDWRDF